VTLALLAPMTPSAALPVPARPADEPTDPEPPESALDTDPEFTSGEAASTPRPVLAVDAPARVGRGSVATAVVTVSGARATDEIVTLEKRVDGAWDVRTSGPVGTDATVSLTLPTEAAGTSSYRVRLPGTTTHDAAVSATFAVEVTDVSTTPTPTPTPSPTPTFPPPRPEPTCGGDAPMKADGTSWVCTYDDEFDGPDLDRKYWVPQKSTGSGFFSGTPTAPACYLDDPRTIAVHDGTLELFARVLDEPVSCGGKTTRLVTGMVTHHGTLAQTYGRYEVRAKVPAFSGTGLQETFWLWPVDVLRYGPKHPMSGEIDFGEFYSTYVDQNIPVVHYLFDPYSMNLQTSRNVYTSWVCKIGVGRFNTYTLIWEPGTIRVLVNGEVCLTNHYTATNAPEGHPYAPFDVPFFLALTQSFGTTGNEFDPATGPEESSTVVDYVRIWQ
jgi:beta-glucanase (GH16 family)